MSFARAQGPSAAAQERQARTLASSRTALPPAGGKALRGEETPGVTGPGRPLPAHDRTRMEHRFGRDFSNVRVHTGSSAPEAVGAKAFAHGRDLVFAPGEYAPQTLPGNQLLTHELAHVAQQADQGAAAIQKQPKDAQQAGGIGATAPAEPFLKATDIAPEDSSVLFDLDKATLSPASQKALLQAIGNHKGPVTVQIDGYASSEGHGDQMGEYNLNLSAHRAAAVKAFLMGKLPAGSKFVLAAHGETTAFAPLEQNRRAGITIRDGVDTPQEAQKKAESATKTAGPASPYPPIDLHPKIDLGSLAPRPYQLVPPGPYLTPIDRPPGYADMNWDDLRSKAMDHGLRIDDSLANSLTQHFTYSFNFFVPFFGRDNALAASNFATNYVFNNFLQNENPNAFDRFNLQFQQAYPNETHIIIPFLSSDSLDWIRKKWKGNSKDDYYFRFNTP